MGVTKVAENNISKKQSGICVSAVLPLNANESAFVAGGPDLLN
jgi:hypothetical protein